MNGLAPKMSLCALLDEPRAPGLEICGISDDSRDVRPGDAFAAVVGDVFDGHDHAAAAVRRGAACVLSERPLPGLPVPVVQVPELRARCGALAAKLHAAPSRKMVCVGVTGTNGKTTVAHHVARLARRGAYMGTLGWGVPPRLCRSELTTADPISLQARLRALKDRGAAAVALEASSHALHQGRVDEVDFAAGVFTNLTRDHLDYHGTMRAYANAKRRLFERPLRFAVVHVDDVLGRTIAREMRTGVELVSVGRQAAVCWRDVAYAPDGIRGVWRTPWGVADFDLPGHFGDLSVRNAACALAAACALGTPLARVVADMARLPPVRGRLQRLGAAPLVLVDYAHTPDALRSALAAVRAHLPAGGQLLVVFGCGGDRDRGKRPQMAGRAEAGADLVVLTSDNPRGEDPQRILDDAMRGFRQPGDVLRIADRRCAIAAALERAGPNDAVLIAGKGHETHQEIGGRKFPFDDAAVVRQLLGERRLGGRGEDAGPGGEA